MLSEARPKKIMETLERAQNAQFWGLKTWGQREAGPLGPHGSTSSIKQLLVMTWGYDLWI